MVAPHLQRGTCGVPDVPLYLIKFSFWFRGEDPLLKSLAAMVTGCGPGNLTMTLCDCMTNGAGLSDIFTSASLEE